MEASMKILIFERHAELRQTLLDWLEHSLPGCTCLGAGERDQFIELCLEQRPQAVVLDSEFSRLGGVTATGASALLALKAILPAMALVMFDTQAESPEDWLSLGPLDAFVPEPRLRSDLTPTVSRLLGI
jgi:DNA-binding NarL/FixJ family response regulator